MYHTESILERVLSYRINPREGMYDSESILERVLSNRINHRKGIIIQNQS